jgi:hypothetical protein
MLDSRHKSSSARQDSRAASGNTQFQVDMRIPVWLPQLEARVAELQQQQRDAAQLLEKREKELAAVRLRAERLSEARSAADAARQAAEAHAKKLEAKFEVSGRGVALLKAARLGAELEASQADAEALRVALRDKARRSQ